MPKKENYSWFLNNVGVRGAKPLHSRKLAYNFWLPPDLTTNSLPLTRSLTNNINSWRTHILYIICTSTSILCIQGTLNFFLIFSLFLGYRVCEFLQVVANVQEFFNMFIEKKSTYKWTCTVQTCALQGSLYI